MKIIIYSLFAGIFFISSVKSQPENLKSVQSMKDEDFGGEMRSLEMLPLEISAYFFGVSNACRIIHVEEWNSFSYQLAFRKNDKGNTTIGTRRKPLIVQQRDMVIDIDRFSAKGKLFESISKNIEGIIGGGNLNAKGGGAIKSPYVVIEILTKKGYSFWVLSSSNNEKKYDAAVKLIDEIENAMRGLKLE